MKRVKIQYKVGENELPVYEVQIFYNDFTYFKNKCAGEKCDEKLPKSKRDERGISYSEMFHGEFSRASNKLFLHVAKLDKNIEKMHKKGVTEMAKWTINRMLFKAGYCCDGCFVTKSNRKEDHNAVMDSMNEENNRIISILENEMYKMIKEYE